MTPREIEEICRRWYTEVWVDGRLETIDELLHPECLSENLDMPGAATRGISTMKMLQQTFLDAFSERTMSVEDVIVNENRAAVRFTFMGRQTGKLWGFPPRGILIRMAGISFLELENGKFIHAWNIWDRFGVMAQLGVVKFA